MMFFFFAYWRILQCAFHVIWSSFPSDVSVALPKLRLEGTSGTSLTFLSSRDAVFQNKSLSIHIDELVDLLANSSISLPESRP